MNSRPKTKGLIVKSDAYAHPFALLPRIHSITQNKIPMRLNSNVLALLAASSLFLASCKKETPEPAPPPVQQESGESSTDNRDVQSEDDVVMGDINTVIMDNSRFSGRVSGAQGAASATLCGLSVDTAGAAGGSLTLNFDGTTCNNRTRTGAIKVAIQGYSTGMRWKNAGCVLRVEFVDYKVTRASDQKSVKLNGVQYFTNVSGGGWWELLFVKTQTVLVTSVTGTDLKVTFDDGKIATYNIHRKVSYSLPNNILTCTAEGIGSNGSLQNLENYGTTRQGEAFTSQVNTPIVWNWTCGAFAPLGGDVNIQVAGKAFTLRCTFGTDAAGNPVTVGSNQCPYGWKLQWSVNGQNQSRIIGYK